MDSNLGITEDNRNLCQSQSPPSAPTHVKIMVDNENYQTGCSIIKSCGKKRKRVFEIEVEGDFLSNIWDQLLIEILLRLPSKTVCQYKTVCKHWCRLICSTYFIGRAISHDRQCRVGRFGSFTLLFECKIHIPHSVPGSFRCSYPVNVMSNHSLLSKSYKNQCLGLKFLRPVNYCDSKEEAYATSLQEAVVYVVASSHDLLLCYRFSNYYVVNLVTKQWVMLPYNMALDRNCPLYLCYKTGFVCYDDQNDVNSGDGWYRFKVIRIPFVYKYSLNCRRIPPEINSSRFTIQIFCSVSGRWSNCYVDWYPLSLNVLPDLDMPILSHNGMLHWLNNRSLVSLDPFKYHGNSDQQLKLSHAVDLPEELACQTLELRAFGVCQGHLRVAHYIKEAVEGRILLVWELEDYNKGVWKLAHRVVLDKSPLNQFKSLTGYNFVFMSFHPFDKDIIFVGVMACACQINLQTGRTERSRKLKPEKSSTYAWFSGTVPPLLHQGFPTPVAPVHSSSH